MYYLAFFKLHLMHPHTQTKVNVIRTFYSNGSSSLEEFKQMVSEKALSFIVIPGSTYEISIYSFDLLNEFLSFLSSYCKNLQDTQDEGVPAPKVAFASSSISGTIIWE